MYQTLLIALLSFIGPAKKTITDDPVNYYGTPNSYVFNKLTYNFSWSAHPAATFYKHQYIPKGENPDHFNDMMMIDLTLSDVSVFTAVQAQMGKLNERKQTDKICNFQLNESPDGKEFILDFLMSEAKGDDVTLVEWSAYHYKEFDDKAGHKGVLMFGVCHRAYGNTSPFLKKLANYRTSNLNELIKYPMPKILLK